MIVTSWIRDFIGPRRTALGVVGLFPQVDALGQLSPSLFERELVHMGMA